MLLKSSVLLSILSIFSSSIIVSTSTKNIVQIKILSSPFEIFIFSTVLLSPVGKLKVISPVLVLIFGSIFEEVNFLNLSAISFSLPCLSINLIKSGFLLILSFLS